VGDLPTDKSKPIGLGEKVGELIPGLSPDDVSIIAGLALQAGQDDYSKPNGDRPFSETMETAYGQPKEWQHYALGRLATLEGSEVPKEISEISLLAAIAKAISSDVISRFTVHSLGPLPKINGQARKALSRDQKYNELNLKYRDNLSSRSLRLKRQGRALTLIALIAAGKVSGNETPELTDRQIIEIDFWYDNKSRGV
jgi:hypothetical protein